MAATALAQQQHCKLCCPLICAQGGNGDTSWAAYVAGCLLVLALEKGVAGQLAGKSVSILVESDVPEGGCR